MLGINGRKIFLFLFFVQVVCAGQSPVPCSEALGRLTHLIQNNTFEVRREFSNYAELFPQSFLTDISRLKYQNHWLDAGSGEGFAVEDIHNEMVLHVEFSEECRGLLLATAPNFTQYKSCLGSS